MQTQIIYVSPLGNIRLTAEDDALIEAAFDVPATMSQSSTPFLESVCLWLDEYFQGKDPAHRRRSVPKAQSSSCASGGWHSRSRSAIRRPMALLAKEAAREMGIPKMSAQAVGGAMKRNLIAILIPCHRVVGANGKLGGYYGNDRRKIDLLTLEGQDMRGFSK